MERKRPQGRQTHVTDNSKGVARRGSGLGTGPVGSGSNPTGQGSVRPSGTGNVRPSGTGGARPFRAGGTGARNAGTRGGGGKGILILLVIVAAVLIFGGGGGLLGGLFGGGGSGSSNAGGMLDAYLNSGSSGSEFSSGVSTGWTDPSNVGLEPDRTVAAGSRAKYTKILGGGRDTVTVMVYMCGTDLESKGGMATKDLLEMTKATLSSNLRVVVYTGGCTQWNNQVIRPDANQVYEIVNGNLRTVVDDAGTGAMTSPETLTWFIRWCAQNYPANRNELIFWDHGGGSVSGFGYDQKYPRSGSMTLAGIHEALAAGGVQFDFIGFDACLMATVETGLMLEPYADYMIASEETEPGIGWYYTNWLTAFAKDTSMSTLDIGKQITDDFVSNCAAQCRGQSATLSVVDLAELANTAPDALKQFSQNLTAMITSDQYQTVSEARNGTREFARSSVIDQIDLVHFAQNLNTRESAALADALLGAVKYNRTSTDMTNAYGLSIYFPYRKASNVDAAVSTYSAIGMDDSYSKCIREFASLEVSGQVSAGGTSSALPSLLGGFLGSSSGSGGSADMISSLLGGFLGGDFGSISGLDSGNTGFFSGRDMSLEDTAAYLADNYFNPDWLVWTKNSAGQQVISMPEDQWDLVVSLDMNLFYDDGSGYVDLGLDNVFDFDDDGNLLPRLDRTWLAVNGQPVAYYHTATEGEGEQTVIYGYIPALLNGERAELLVVFDTANPRGLITGARYVYKNGETGTVAKNVTELADDDRIEFICDYYTYDGEYADSYLLGDVVTVSDGLELSNVDVGKGAVRVTYRFTDIYQQHYWTEAIFA